MHEISGNSHVDKWGVAPKCAYSAESLMTLGATVATHGDVPWEIPLYRLFYTFFGQPC